MCIARLLVSPAHTFILATSAACPPFYLGMHRSTKKNIKKSFTHQDLLSAILLQSSAVLQLESVTNTRISALQSSAFTMLECPPPAAFIRGVRPFELGLLTLAPIFSTESTALLSPCAQAQSSKLECNGPKDKSALPAQKLPQQGHLLIIVGGWCRWKVRVGPWRRRTTPCHTC